MDTYEQTLQAGVPATFPGGRQFQLLETSDEVDITVFKAPFGSRKEKAKGITAVYKSTYEGTFTKVEVLSSVVQTIKVGITDGDAETNHIGGNVSTDENPGELITVADVTIASGASGTLLAANASRKEAFISSLNTNSGPVRIGDSNVGAARGTELLPGKTIPWKSDTQIEAYNPTGAVAVFGISYTNRG